jgi:hypothetical protein
LGREVLKRKFDGWVDFWSEGGFSIAGVLLYLAIWPIDVNRELSLGLSNVDFVQIQQFDLFVLYPRCQLIGQRPQQVAMNLDGQCSTGIADMRDELIPLLLNRLY